jgi:hypothetical protein
LVKIMVEFPGFYGMVARLKWIGLPIILTAGLLAIISCGSGNSVPCESCGGDTLASIAVTPSDSSVFIGNTQQLIATGTYSDGSTKDVTSSTTWTSSATATATIETKGQPQPGLASGVAAGSVTIAAALSGVTGSTALKVTGGSSGATMIPLMDMTLSDSYLGFPGGLYENGSDTVPSDHDADGLAAAALIQPLDTNGTPSASGKVILISMGMSNAAIEFGSFVSLANASTQVNKTTLHIGNEALSDQDACYWFPATGPPFCNATTENNYDRISADLASNGFSPAQVQVAWIDSANGRVHSENRGCVPLGTLCSSLCDPATAGCVNSEDTTNALNEEEEFGETLRAAKTRFPNLKLIFFSSRVYGGYASPSDADPEPFAYETAYGIKWLIQAQINQIRTGEVDPVAGDLSYGSAPWVAWASYFWADGPDPRSDGLVWCNGQTGSPCNGEVDFNTGGLHLNTTGGNKAGNLLLNYFFSSSYTTAWFTPSPRS